MLASFRYRIYKALERQLASDHLAYLLTESRKQGFDVELGDDIEIAFGTEFVLSGAARVRIGNGVSIRKYSEIKVEGEFAIGDRTLIGRSCSISCRGRLLIGADCMLAESVSVRDHDHSSSDVNLPINEQGYVDAPCVIGNNVWLAAKVTVLKGVTIGDNSIVGANAVVSRDIPPNSIAAGVPARVIKQR